MESITIKNRRGGTTTLYYSWEEVQAQQDFYAWKEYLISKYGLFNFPREIKEEDTFEYWKENIKK